MTTTTETTTALSETERWQIGEARDLLARWDRDRGRPGIYSTERALADTVRGLLVIVEQMDAALAERNALVLAALDEAAADRDYRASTPCTDCTYTGDGPCAEHREHGHAADDAASAVIAGL